MSAQPEQLSILACRLFPTAAAAFEATARDVERRMERRRRMVRVDECMARLVINVFDVIRRLSTTIFGFGFWSLQLESL